MSGNRILCRHTTTSKPSQNWKPSIEPTTIFQDIFHIEKYNQSKMENTQEPKSLDSLLCKLKIDSNGNEIERRENKNRNGISDQQKIDDGELAYDGKTYTI